MRAGHSLHDFTILIICALHNFQFYLAHLWTDFQSCLSQLEAVHTTQQTHVRLRIMLRGCRRLSFEYIFYECGRGPSSSMRKHCDSAMI